MCQKDLFVQMLILVLILFREYLKFLSKFSLTVLQPLRWRCAEMRDSPRTECARRKTLYVCGENKQ